MTPTKPEFLAKLLDQWQPFQEACQRMNSLRTPASRDAVQAWGMAFHHEAWLRHRQQLDCWLRQNFAAAAARCWHTDAKGKVPPELLKRPAMMFAASLLFRPRTVLQTGYQFSSRHGCPTHMFWVKDACGGVHVRASAGGVHFMGQQWWGGVEAHVSVPAEQANHLDCWLLQGPCQHDGSSLAFERRVAPLLPAEAGQRLTQDTVDAVLRVCADFHGQWILPQPEE